MTRFKSLAFLSLFFLSAAATNFTQCLIDFRDSDATEGGTNYHGVNVSNPREAVALTYNACLEWCGSGWEAFNCSVFFQQFSAWLLPWLALISQLPFGAETYLDNLISGGFPSNAHIDVSYRSSYYHVPAVLTVGSPTLAAFSLALTALNTRWTYNRFSDIRHPNGGNAAKALVFLQRIPLCLTTRDGLPASLIVLTENNDWWKCLVDGLEQTHTWTITAGTSIAWVIIAFVFTITDSLMNLGEDVNSNGQGVGSLWLWLIPMIVGSLLVPDCSYDKAKAAINKANKLAFVATRTSLPQINVPPISDTPRPTPDVSYMRAVSMYDKGKTFTKDATRAVPVFNYSRIWEWSSIVETIAQAFERSYENASNHVPVDSRKEWAPQEDKHLRYHRDNRTRTVTQVQIYCGFPVRDEEPLQPAPPGIWKRIFIASVAALGLQWGTTVSAAIVVVFTPTFGLGCRSGSYLLYGVVSTIIWLALLLSSYLANYAKVRHNGGVSPSSAFNSASLAKGLATFLRRLSVLVASLNAIFVILACVSQFSNLYSTCYCNSSVLGRGSQHAYNIIAAGYDYGHMEAAWIGGFVLASGCVGLFLFFLHLILDPFRRAIGC